MSEAGMVTVWARAEQVDLLRDGSAYALPKSRDGWWRCEMKISHR